MFNLQLWSEIKTGISELSEGNLYPKFQKVPLVGKVRILLKVAAAAVVCGIIANMIVGSFLGALVMVAGGIAAFSYFTLAYPMPESWWETKLAHAKASVKISSHTIYGLDREKSLEIQKKFEQKKTSEGIALLFNLKEATHLFDKERYLDACYALMP